MFRFAMSFVLSCRYCVVYRRKIFEKSLLFIFLFFPIFLAVTVRRILVAGRGIRGDAGQGGDKVFLFREHKGDVGSYQGPVQVTLKLEVRCLKSTILPRFPTRANRRPSFMGGGGIEFMVSWPPIHEYKRDCMCVMTMS